MNNQANRRRGLKTAFVQKNSLAERLLETELTQLSALVLIDPKGDTALMQRALQQAEGLEGGSNEY